MDNMRVLMIETPLYSHYVKNAIRRASYGVEIIGVATNVDDALELIRTHKPDILVFDIRGNHLDVFDTLMKIRIEFPDVLVIGRTRNINNRFLLQAAAAGVTGFVNDQTSIVELVDAIDAVRQGHLFLPQNLADQFVQELQHQLTEIQ